jgi:hypothetical protein
LSATTRRPDPNRPPTVNLINLLSQDVLYLITELSNYAANLRALDRQRHNGVGLRRLGFIEAALRLSTKFPQYFPHWLNTEKFQADLDLFNAVRSLVEVCRSLEKKRGTSTSKPRTWYAQMPSNITRKCRMPQNAK